MSLYDLEDPPLKINMESRPDSRVPSQDPTILPIPPRTFDERCRSLLVDFQDLRNDAESSVPANPKLRGVASQLEDLRFRFEIWKTDIGIDPGILSQNVELTNSITYRVIVTAFDRIESQLASVKSAISIIKKEIEKTSLLRFSIIQLVRLNLSSKSAKAFNAIRDSSNIIKSVLRNLADILAPWQMLYAIHNTSGPLVEFRNHVSTVKRRVEAEQSQRLIERDISLPMSASNELDIRRSPPRITAHNEVDIRLPSPRVIAPNELDSRRPSPSLSDSNEVDISRPSPPMSASNEVDIRQPSPPMSASNEVDIRRPSPLMSASNELDIRRSPPRITAHNEVDIRLPSPRVIAHNELDSRRLWSAVTNHSEDRLKPSDGQAHSRTSNSASNEDNVIWHPSRLNLMNRSENRLKPSSDQFYGRISDSRERTSSINSDLRVPSVTLESSDAKAEPCSKLRDALTTLSVPGLPTVPMNRRFFPRDKIIQHLTRDKVLEILHCPCQSCQADRGHLKSNGYLVGVESALDFTTTSILGLKPNQGPNRTVASLFGLLLYIGRPLLIYWFLRLSSNRVNDFQLSSEFDGVSKVFIQILGKSSERVREADYIGLDPLVSIFQAAFYQFAVPYMSYKTISKYDERTILPFLSEAPNSDAIGGNEETNKEIISFKIWPEYNQISDTNQNQFMLKEMTKIEFDRTKLWKQFHNPHILSIVKKYFHGTKMYGIYPQVKANLSQYLRGLEIEADREQEEGPKISTILRQLCGVMKAWQYLHKRFQLQFSLKPQDIFIMGEKDTFVISDLHQFRQEPDLFEPGRDENSWETSQLRFFGCLLVEIATYVAKGKEGLRDLDQLRSNSASSTNGYLDSFFSEGYSDRVKPAIHDWVSRIPNISSISYRSWPDSRRKSRDFLIEMTQMAMIMLESTGLSRGYLEHSVTDVIRMLDLYFTKEEVEEHIASLERHKTTLSLALSSDQTSLLLGIDGNVSQLQQDQNLAEQDRQIDKLLVAEGATFDSFRQHETQCVQNTRVDLLRQVQTWSTSDDKCIFWLNGMAGTGKSTIARTVACAFANQNRLGASFFFSRGTGDLGHATKFVTTLAHQLASVSPLFKEHISQAIADNHDVTRQGLHNQWKELILKPLSMLKGPKITLNLVIDALDECEREEDIKLILQLFVQVNGLVTVKLKVFLTSRPETPIRLGFQHMSEILHRDLILHDIPRSIVEHDIRVFLSDELNMIRKDRNLLSLGDWPDNNSIDLLVKRSDCLFLYIATVCRFIRDPKWHPQERLSLIIESDAINHDQITAKLDGMYMQILKLSVIGVSDEKDIAHLSERFKNIVGSIVTLFDVLSTISLAGLLNISIGDISLTLDALHSVLNIPRDQKLPIRLLHPSFRDFLVSNTRCDDSCFYISQELIHTELATSCLRLLSRALRRDMCILRKPGILIHEVQSSEINRHLSKEVQYACQYWVDHLERVDHERRIKIGLYDDGKIHVFLLEHILHWLEALSLMGKISKGVRMITRLEAMLKPDEGYALKAAIYDAKRFILSNRSIIEAAPLQLYYSALVFCPKLSVIKAAFLNQLPTWITGYPVMEDNWSSSLQILEGHQSTIDVLAFSSNSQLLASASADYTIRLWDSATGMLRSTLEGHESFIAAVAFSNNDQLLASASWDKTVRLWDSATGILRNRLKAHTDHVKAVAFSGNDQLLASASADGTIRLWDSVTGTLQSTLESHTCSIIAVAFSSKGQLLAAASASRDRTIRLWDPATQTLQKTLEGHTDQVTRMSFSDNGQLLASASRDHTVRLWDSVTGTLQSTLEGHTQSVHAVTFSGDGQLLTSASRDNTIRLWDTATGTLRNTIEGHETSIAGVAISRNGQLLASACQNQTIRLWDPATPTLQNMLECHKGRVTAVAFSGDGQLLASASADNTVRLWDSATGTLQSTLEDHTDCVTAVVFSNRGNLLASASDDGTIGLWNSATGTLKSRLEGHLDQITAVAFSNRGNLLATASRDRTVRLWDSATGTLQSTLKDHTDWVTAVAFSDKSHLLVSASRDQTVRLWDSATGTLQSTLEGHTDCVRAVAFSNRGHLVASASLDHTVRLWDSVTGTLQSTLGGHTRCVHAVAFSGDGQFLASASDFMVRLWDPATANLVQQFEVDGVEELSFSPDGRQLVTNLGLIQLSGSGSTGGQSLQSGAWMVQRNWLTWNNRKVLWLPPDFRPSCLAIRGNLIVMGHSSGRVTFLELQSNFNQ